MKIKPAVLILVVFISCTTYDRNSDVNYSAAMDLYRQSVAAESQQDKMRLRVDIICLSPRSEYGLFAKGWMLYMEDDFKGSIELYTSAIELNPAEALFYYNRAVSSLILFKENGNKQHIARASADLDCSIKLDPAYANSYSMRAETESILKKYDAAIADYTAAIKLDGKNPQLWFNRGLVRLRGLNDSKGAVSDATRAIEINPQFAEAWCLRGLARFNLNDKKGACSDYRRAWSIDPDSCLFGGEGGIIPGCND
ncbi:MAG TPA: tetratricopeptide repeat protein [Spirochaetota bacterium]|nr:tetratricopeptide repeat protein [Spirochaetota bacterium]